MLSPDVEVGQTTNKPTDGGAKASEGAGSVAGASEGDGSEAGASEDAGVSERGDGGGVRGEASALLVLLIAVWTGYTYWHVSTNYASGEALWAAACRAAPKSVRVMTMYAGKLAAKGDWDGATKVRGLVSSANCADSTHCAKSMSSRRERH